MPPLPILGGGGRRMGSLMGEPMDGGPMGDRSIGGSMGGRHMGREYMEDRPMGGKYMEDRPMGGESSEADGLHTLFIYNIGPEAVEVDIYSLCSPFGAVSKVHIQRDKTGKARGFCFVTFHDYVAAKKAIETLNGQPYFKNNGRKLQVKFHEPNEKK
jgi:hypothetical protein